MHTGIRLKEKVRPIAKKIRGISHDHRIALLYLLAHGPMEVKNIVANVDVPQNLVSHHLKKLLTTGWVTKVRWGRTVTYQVNRSAFEEIGKFLAQLPLAHLLKRQFPR